MRDEVVGPAGPTTATRMDKFTDLMLERTGLLAMVGKAERGPAAIESIRRHGAAYLMAVGGAAYLVVQGDPRGAGRGILRPRHGSDLRVRGQGHARDRRGRCARRVGAPDGPAQTGLARSARSASRCAWRDAATSDNEDSLRRFVFERYPFRGQLVHLGPPWRAMMEHHDYPARVRDSLGEAVAAAVLLSATLKYQGLLSLQLRGDGPMHLMLVECSDGLAVRAVARFRDPPDTRDLRVAVRRRDADGDSRKRRRGAIATRGSCRSRVSA